MKIKFVLATAAISMLALASCRKDYSCYCSEDGNKYKVAEYKNVKKATAESACASYAVYGANCDIE